MRTALVLVLFALLGIVAASTFPDAACGQVGYGSQRERASQHD